MLNELIKTAISEAVAEKGQAPDLADKLISWMAALCEGNEEISVKNSYTRRCDYCFGAVDLKKNR